MSKPENESIQPVTENSVPMVHAITTVTYTKQDVLDIIDHMVDGVIKIATAVQKLNLPL